MVSGFSLPRRPVTRVTKPNLSSVGVGISSVLRNGGSRFHVCHSDSNLTGHNRMRTMTVGALLDYWKTEPVVHRIVEYAQVANKGAE